MTTSSSSPAKLPRLRDKTITLAHGSGGQAMQDLIEALFVSQFEGKMPTALEDQARIPLDELTAQGDRRPTGLS
jgi:hydrogenase expression/formation protein HypE